MRSGSLSGRLAGGRGQERVLGAKGRLWRNNGFTPSHGSIFFLRWEGDGFPVFVSIELEAAQEAAAQLGSCKVTNTRVHAHAHMLKSLFLA